MTMNVSKDNNLLFMFLFMTRYRNIGFLLAFHASYLFMIENYIFVSWEKQKYNDQTDVE